MLDRLVDLHPHGDASPFPPRPPVIATLCIDPDLLRKCIRKLTNGGGGGGPSGWTFDHLKPIMKEDGLLKSVGALIGAMINASLPEYVMKLLLASRLIPLFKDASRDPSKIRPIAVGEIFVRIAEAYNMTELSSVCPALFAPPYLE